MSNSHQKRKKSGKKYPGFRPCLNHGTLSEMFKNAVPELCPQCFGSTARHQVQLVALNYSSVTHLRYAMVRIQDKLTDIEELLLKHMENGVT